MVHDSDSHNAHHCDLRVKNFPNQLGVRPRGRTATQHSKKGSEKVLERVLGRGSQKGSENGVCCAFYTVKKGF